MKWPTLADIKGTPITPEIIEAGAKLIMENYGALEVEYHSYKCPKITSGGKLACRCGAAPMEAVFEDDLIKRQKETK